MLLQDILYYLTQAFQLQNYSSVAIVTVLWANKELFQFSAAARISFAENIQALSVTHPTMGTVGISPGNTAAEQWS